LSNRIKIPDKNQKHGSIPFQVLFELIFANQIENPAQIVTGKN
jgi:hypothetical protein